MVFGKAGGHQPDHCDLDEVFGVGGAAFVVPAQPAAAGQPAQSNVIECCFNRLKQFRDLATRYAKRAAYYHAELTIATIILSLQ